MQQSILDGLRARVADAAAHGRPLRIRGGGSKDFYGQPAEGELLDTRGYQGVVDYEPTELVLTARCGTPLADVEALLAGRGQMLAFEPPHFGPGATLGGCIAAGLSGPRRQAAGSVRDFVLGAKLLDGRGQILSFGGQVMKNVAGYDLSRALAGSLGILGVIVEVSLKVLPRSMASLTVAFDMDETTALAKLNAWAGQPLPITASAWHDGTLLVRLAGAEAAITASRSRLGGSEVDEAQAASYWSGVREQTLAFFAGDTPLWRLSLTSTAPAIALPGAQLIEWGGALRWWKTDAPAETVREATRGLGHATLFRAADALRASAGVFQTLDPVLARIHGRLKAELDPAGIFNPGRMFRDL